jgi:transcriptional regulator with XRE-family HTH domain
MKIGYIDSYMGNAQKSELFRRVGQNVSKQRYAKDFNQTKFADRLGISRTSLALIEAGKQGLTLSRLYQIASTLEVEVATLLPPVSEVFPTSTKGEPGKPEVTGLKEESVQLLEDILKKRKGREYRDEASNNTRQKAPAKNRNRKSSG